MLGEIIQDSFAAIDYTMGSFFADQRAQIGTNHA